MWEAKFYNLLDDLVREGSSYKGQMQRHKWDPKKPNWSGKEPPPLPGQPPPLPTHKPIRTIRSTVGEIIIALKDLRKIIPGQGEEPISAGGEMGRDNMLINFLQVMGDVGKGYAEKIGILWAKYDDITTVSQMHKKLYKEDGTPRNPAPKGSSPLNAVKNIQPGELHPNQPSTLEINPEGKFTSVKSFFGTYLPQFEKEAKAMKDIMREWRESIEEDKFEAWWKIRGPEDTYEDFEKWKDDKDKAANKGSRNSGAPATPDFQALAVQSEKLSASSVNLNDIPTVLYQQHEFPSPAEPDPSVSTDSAEGLGPIRRIFGIGPIGPENPVI